MTKVHKDAIYDINKNLSKVTSNQRCPVLTYFDHIREAISKLFVVLDSIVDNIISTLHENPMQ